MLSGGKLNSKLTAPVKPATLGDLIDGYFARPSGKEKNTLETEALHARHFSEEFGRDKSIRSFTKADVQDYVWRRRESVQPATAKKETATLRMLLYRSEEITQEKPAGDVRELFRGLEYGKTDQKHEFMTLEQITSRIERFKLDAKTAKSLWDRAFLTRSEVEEFLDWAEQRPSRQPVPYLPAMLTAAAHTGARLSELARSRVEDWDFEAGVVNLREKKKSRTQNTTRQVDISTRLAKVMQEWFAKHHPGGKLVFCARPDVQLVSRQLFNKFKDMTKNSKWANLRGYHVFRHSFASNLALIGVDERMVDKLMGHQTEEMRKRYRHFFPEQRREAIKTMFG